MIAQEVREVAARHDYFELPCSWVVLGKLTVNIQCFPEERLGVCKVSSGVESGCKNDTRPSHVRQVGRWIGLGELPVDCQCLLFELYGVSKFATVLKRDS